MEIRDTFLEREVFMKKMRFSELLEGGDLLSLDEEKAFRVRYKTY